VCDFRSTLKATGDLCFRLINARVKVKSVRSPIGGDAALRFSISDSPLVTPIAPSHIYNEPRTEINSNPALLPDEFAFARVNPRCSLFSQRSRRDRERLGNATFDFLRADDFVVRAI